MIRLKQNLFYKLSLYLIIVFIGCSKLTKEEQQLFKEAIIKNQREYIENILSKGVDLNNEKIFGYIPLHIAVEANNISLISLFLKNGADINKVDELGQNCLFKTYNIDTIRYLIENGANVNQAEIYGTLPVFNVTWNYDLAKLYIESGSDIYHKDMNGRTVLFYALSDDNYKLIQYLIKKDDGIVKDEDNDGYNTLIWYSALGKGDLRVLKLLLECGLEINGQNKKGLNALIVSIINVKFHKKEKYLLSNNIRYIKLLIERGIDVNHKDDYGNTALHCAIRVEREIELLKLLLDNGAKVDIKNKKGETPLDIAIKKGDKVIINLLKSYVKFTRMYNTTGI